MPLYEYECAACGARFDKIVSMSQADAGECPRCGGTEARRLLSVIAGLGGRAEPPAPQCGGGACGAC